MALLSPTDQDRLRTEFSSMTRDVRLLFFTQTLECPTCLQTRLILDELLPLSSRITIEEVNLILDKDRVADYGIDRAPSVAIVSVNDSGEVLDSRIRFVGAPAGYEFVSLVRAVQLVGGSASTLSAASRELLDALDHPVTLKVFSTPTCPHCPKAVALANELAFASPLVTAYAFEATEFPDLTRRYRVTGVPKTIVNDAAEILGAVPEDTFVEQVIGGSGQEAVG
jgi:glutaredoxin-like protein